jgi:hypothetical protein
MKSWSSVNEIMAIVICHVHLTSPCQSYNLNLSMARHVRCRAGTTCFLANAAVLNQWLTQSIPPTSTAVNCMFLTSLLPIPLPCCLHCFQFHPPPFAFWILSSAVTFFIPFLVVVRLVCLFCSVVCSVSFLAMLILIAVDHCVLQYKLLPKSSTSTTVRRVGILPG